MDLNLFTYITITLIAIILYIELSRWAKLLINILSSINLSIKDIEFRIKKLEENK